MLDFVNQYFPNEFYEEVAKYTNMYAVQRGVAFVPVDSTEVRSCFAIHQYMGALRYPRIPMYWRKGMAIPEIREEMTRDRFFNIRSHMHFVDETIVDKIDKFYKVS